VREQGINTDLHRKGGRIPLCWNESAGLSGGETDSKEEWWTNSKCPFGYGARRAQVLASHLRTHSAGTT
jgi:hypothetical protein